MKKCRNPKYNIAFEILISFYHFGSTVILVEALLVLTLHEFLD